jgi:enediyne polyketide synthase
VHAVERVSDGDNFVYDLRIEDANGRLCEQWEGLHLRAVAMIDARAGWPLPLLVPYLERRIGQLLPCCGIQIGLLDAKKEQLEDVISHSIREMFGSEAMLVHRPDGKPEIVGTQSSEPHISISHAGDISLLFSATQNAGCDLEKIVCRDSACWEQLLGVEEFALAELLAGESKGSFNDAATQVWTLKESLRKAGSSFGQSMSLSARSTDGWASFSARGFTAATFKTVIEGSAFAFGFVLQGTP